VELIEKDGKKSWGRAVCWDSACLDTYMRQRWRLSGQLSTVHNMASACEITIALYSTVGYESIMKWPFIT
jgi:hypothetical protein